MSTAAAIRGRHSKDTTRTVKADAVRLAKKAAYVEMPGPCTRECGIDTPGRRNVSNVSSSPAAFAMYLSTTDYTGVTQARSITPPSGYSNTNCCADDAGSCALPNTAAIDNQQCSTPGASGCCIYRGRGIKPTKKYTPGQLAAWRMGPVPNRMQRIGNVKPKSAADNEVAARVGKQVAFNNLPVIDNAVHPVLGSNGAYVDYIKNSNIDCQTGECYRQEPWQNWPIAIKTQTGETACRLHDEVACRNTTIPNSVQLRLSAALNPPIRCSPNRVALLSAKRLKE